MKTLNQCFFAIFCFTLILGCKKENNPSPTDRSLPQGFTVYDDFRLFNSATILDNGEVVIAGILKEENGLGLLKLDKDCKEIWSKSYFDVNYSNTAKVIKQRNDGLIITGTLNTIPSITSLDKDGNEIWCKKIVQTGFTEGLNTIQTMDDGVLAVGTVLDSGFNAFVIKYNELGEEIWRTNYKDDNFFLQGFYPVEISNGDIIISTGKIVPPQSSLTYLKINSKGEKISITDVELPLSGVFPNIKTIKTVNSELLTAMSSPRNLNSSLSSTSKVKISKTDPKKWLIWEKTINIGTTNNASSVLELATKDIIFLGTVGSPIQRDEKRESILIKMDSQGEEIWRKIYSLEQNFSALDIVETIEGFLIIGYLTPVDDEFNFMATILKVDKEGNPL